MTQHAQRRDRRPARAGHVEMCHEGERCDSTLLVTQHRVFFDPFEEPIAERRLGLDHATAEQVDVGIACLAASSGSTLASSWSGYCVNQ